MSKNLGIVDEFFNAYNSLNIPNLETLLDDNVHWEHHNRFSGDGRTGLIASIKLWSELAPGRHFGPVLRSAENGDVLFIEHKWFATVDKDNLEFGWKAGQDVTLDAASVFVIRGGVIVEWSDYG